MASRNRIVALLLLPFVFAVPSHPVQQRSILPDPVCIQIGAAISSASDVYYAGHPLYVKGIYHWASSSAQLSNCVVEPGTAADVAIILSILGSTNTPFAVKGGGHASNPGYSSTTGVQIAMYRFSEVTYDAALQTAVIGAGLIWDDVYAALEPFNVNVVGGRVTGVGVAGFILGGGYSWKTNQHGLTIDTVTAFELVKPNGNIVTVTQASDPNLFFGLKGGFNNFGIVTRFTLKTFPQTQVWGGLITITEPFIPDVAAATAAFGDSVTDPKAGIITTYNFLLGSPGISQLLFYDGPTPPAGIFDDFLAIPYLTKDISTRSFSSLVQSSPANATSGTRGVFNTVSVLSFTPALLDVILNETIFWGQHLSLKGGVFISYDVEPFLSNIYNHNLNPTAFPPVRSLGLLPFNIYYAWTSSLFDGDFHDAAKASAANVYNAAVSEGQAGLVGAPVYPNYAIFDTPLSDIYGSNLATLQALKASVDPTNIMGLAGGWKYYLTGNRINGYATASVEGRIAVEYFDPSPQAQEKKYAFKCHTFHPVYNTFASAGSDGTVSIWDHKVKKRLRQYPKYPGPVSAVAFNCDGSKIAVGVSYTWDEGEAGLKANPVTPWIGVRKVGDEVKDAPRFSAEMKRR